MGTLDRFILPGIGSVEGRSPTLGEYGFALMFLRAERPFDTQAIARLEGTIRRRHWADAVKGGPHGDQDGDKLDGGHMESDPGLLEGE